MAMRSLFIFIFTSFSLFGTQEVTLTPKKYRVLLEHAVTPRELTLGLMNRFHLGENEGMAFHYSQKQLLSFWMFNCFIDLSLAFLDENHVIQEIHEMRAYPEKMDRKRVVENLNDLSLYSIDEEITKFFIKRSVTSSFQATYALEMNKGWFKKNNISKNDVALFDSHSKEGVILKTINVTPLIKEAPLKIHFSEKSEVSLITFTKNPLDVIFFNERGQTVYKTLVPNQPVYTTSEVTDCMILPQKKDTS
jgi:uncharacterized membrane protein (UPF0127 family)